MLACLQCGETRKDIIGLFKSDKGLRTKFQASDSKFQTLYSDPFFESGFLVIFYYPNLTNFHRSSRIINFPVFSWQ